MKATSDLGLDEAVGRSVENPPARTDTIISNFSNPSEASNEYASLNAAVAHSRIYPRSEWCIEQRYVFIAVSLVVPSDLRRTDRFGELAQYRVHS